MGNLPIVTLNVLVLHSSNNLVLKHYTNKMIRN